MTETTVKTVVMEGVLDANDALALANRAVFDRYGIYAVNLMSSPGSGKTTLLERTIERMVVPSPRGGEGPGVRGRLPSPRGGEGPGVRGIRLGVLEGDVQTSLDADRLARYGAPVVQINTYGGFGGSCHLDANMIRVALPQLPLDEIDLLFIENVGNLVCPAAFKLGENVNVVVASITEGEDKPLKYPLMFRAADLVLINKIDLLPHLDFDIVAFEHNVNAVNPAVTSIRLSARTGEGLEEWIAWLSNRRKSSAT